MSRAYREQKLRRMLSIIHNDLNRILNLRAPSAGFGGASTTSQDYLQRQIDKYLKPLDTLEFRDQVRTLLIVFRAPPLINEPGDGNAISYRRPNWDTEGLGDDHVPVMYKMGGGWSHMGKHGGTKIRINQKAFWMFPELTLRGVMVHEATHYALDTEDIHYSSFTRNSVMQGLTNGSRNADNWRIFYQKMSAHMAGAPTD
jgi:hypothetical protein